MEEYEKGGAVGPVVSIIKSYIKKVKLDTDTHIVFLFKSL